MKTSFLLKRFICPPLVPDMSHNGADKPVQSDQGFDLYLDTIMSTL